MKKNKSKVVKVTSKRSFIILGVVAVIVLIGLYIKSLIASPQVALIAEPATPMCISNITSMSFHDECGNPGTFKRAIYTCSNGSTAEKLASGENCIAYSDIMTEAQKNCGQTCNDPSPIPSCVPNPCPAGAACKLMALPSGQVYCPVATSTPYPSTSPVASPSPTRTPFPSPSPTPNPTKSFFKITNHPNPVNITCTEGDINCGFYLPVIYQNITSYDLYQATYWTDTPGVKFSNQYGVLTDQKVVLTSPIFFEPGLGPNVIVATKVTPDMKPGVYVRRVYMDAKQCNQIGDVLDCYYGGSAGATTFTINLTLLPRSVQSPTPTSTATPIPSPVYSTKPSPAPSLVAAPTPTITPRSVTKQTFGQCYSVCRAKRVGVWGCVRSCTR